MTDETLELAPETEANDEVQPDVELETAGDEGDQPELSEDQPEDDGLDDLEWEGLKTRVPKDMKSALEERLGHMSKHFTTKSQTIAAQQKETEQRLQAADEELDIRAGLKAINAEIQQYQNVDWQKLENEDIVGAQSHWRRYQQLKEAAQNSTAELNQKVTARTEQAKQETAQRLQETREFAEKKIPGWSPDVDAKVTEFATSELGLSRDMLLGAYTPQIYRALHLAWLGHQAMKSKPAAQKPKPVEEPLKTVRAKATTPPVGLDDRLSADEWVKRRNQQVRGR